MPQSALTSVKEIMDAPKWNDFFAMSDPGAARKMYLRYARIVHPDTAPPEVATVASAAFIKLQQMYETFENGGVAPRGAHSVSKGAQSLHGRKDTYVLGAHMKTFEGYALFAVNGPEDKHYTLLVSTTHDDADLVRAGAVNLKEVNTQAPKEFSAFFPQYVDHMRISLNGVNTFGYLIEDLPDGFVSLRDLLHAHAGGLQNKDVAWIFRRMLVAVGVASDCGFAHTSPTIDAFYIDTQKHGLILSNWFGSVKIGEPLQILHEDFKYPEWMHKKDTTHSFDVALAAQSATLMLKNNNNRDTRTLKSFFQGCQVKDTPRPSSLLMEFDDVIQRLYGDRKFHIFGSD